MGNTNPFEIIIVITAILLMVGAASAIVAPSFGVKTPSAPEFPSFPNINGQGNLSDTYPFSESHFVLTSSGEVKYAIFNPDKMVHFVLEYGGFQITRFGEILIFPHWFDEPITYLNGSKVGTTVFNVITPRTINDNFNGTYSNFIVDNGNNQYQAYVSFSPLPGYSDMVTSWNIGHGFTVWLYGSAYAPPSWMDQLVSYLTFGAALVAYFLYFLAYMITMAGVMFQVIGLAPAIATGVSALITIVFIGSLLMFIRGGSSK